MALTAIVRTQCVESMHSRDILVRMLERQRAFPLTGSKIVITNYHVFKLRERISKGGRQLLKGRTGEEVQTPYLLGMKNIPRRQ
jgi:nucleoid DNA-binding protein